MGHLVLAVQGTLIEGWYLDLYPGDNDIVLDMSTGSSISP
jgi:hypothetical protein